MSVERMWVTILALTSFLSGSAGGFLYALHVNPQERPGPFAAYEERLVQTFDLDEERALWLHGILGRYDEEIEVLKARHVRDLDPELVALGETCRKRIRSWVVPLDRQAEFDRPAHGNAPPPFSTQTGSSRTE